MTPAEEKDVRTRLKAQLANVAYVQPKVRIPALATDVETLLCALQCAEQERDYTEERRAHWQHEAEAERVRADKLAEMHRDMCGVSDGLQAEVERLTSDLAKVISDAGAGKRIIADYDKTVKRLLKAQENHWNTSSEIAVFRDLLAQERARFEAAESKFSSLERRSGDAVGLVELQFVTDEAWKMAKAYTLGSPESRAVVTTIEHIRAVALSVHQAPVGGALTEAADQVEKIAFEMPPGNGFTPRFVLLARAMRRQAGFGNSMEDGA